MSINAQSDNLSLAYYCQRFSALKVSSTKQRGNAHYKPILLLAVIDLIAQGIIKENKIYVEDILLENFNKYWVIIAEDSSYKGGLHYPFMHLQSEGFWHIKFSSDFKGLQPKTLNQLKKSVEYASFDSNLFALLQDSQYCQVLIDHLVANWFGESQKSLELILTLNKNFEQEEKKDVKIFNSEDLPRWSMRKSAIRNAFFRKSLVQIYDYSCAICELKVIKNINQNIVDGAHIKPFSIFYDSSINNGICFCKNHHWAFDMGWFTIDDDYKIIVTSDLQEKSPNAQPLRYFSGKSMILPPNEEYLPSCESLQWHRQNVFAS